MRPGLFCLCRAARYIGRVGNFHLFWELESSCSWGGHIAPDEGVPPVISVHGLLVCNLVTL